MAQQLTAEDGKEALRDHLERKAIEARLKHGFYIDADAIVRMLSDRDIVRYPVGIRFDAQSLDAGEFAWAAPIGEHPSDGFCLFMHPWFEDQPDAWPLLIAYHIPSINYGEIVGSDDAEVFGAALLGLDCETYYQALCELCDSIPTG